jgi:excisionase family DNA binding protein
MKKDQVGSLDELPDVLTVAEAGEVLRLGRNSVYEAIRRKEIPSVKLGKRLLVPKEGLQRLLSGKEKE